MPTYTETTHTASWLIDELTNARVFDAVQLGPYMSEFRASHPKGGDALALAQYLVNAGLLTVYQADCALSGDAVRLSMGPYLLAEPLGAGSLGSVFMAVHRTNRGRYAVKVLPLRSLWNVRQAKRQLDVFASLPAHPAIVPFVDIDSSGGHHYLVWPFAEGQTISNFVERNGPLAVDDAIRTMQEAAEGLAICHANQIVHGLLNPANLLAGFDGQTRVLDLGVGAILSDNISDDESMLDTISTANTAMRMIDYCAPETHNSPTHCSVSGDLYSFGCVLFYSLTGTIPFPDGNIVDRMIAHQTQAPPSVAELNPEVPEWLASLIAQLLNKLPEGRPASMAEVVAIIARNQPVDDVSRTPTPLPAPVPAAKWNRQLVASADFTKVRSEFNPHSVRASGQTAETIDFGEYTPPSQSTDELPSPSKLKSESAIPEFELPNTVIPYFLSNQSSRSTVRTISQEETPQPIPTRLKSALPAPVEYTELAQPDGQYSVSPSARPRFARTWFFWWKKTFLYWLDRPGDVVQLSIFGPPNVSPGESVKLQVFAHIPESFASVCTLSRAFHIDGELIATGFVQREVQHGANLGLQLQVANAGIAQSFLTLGWLGQSRPRAFDIYVPWESPDGLSAANLTLAVDGIPSGTIAFQIEILPRRG